MITGINKSKTLTKHVSCKCECKFDSRKCNLNQNWNSKKCWCECKNEKNVCVKKDYIWNVATWSRENGKYLGNVIENSEIKCDEIINEEETKAIPTKSILTKVL